jgi:hypothetical protein
MDCIRNIWRKCYELMFGDNVNDGYWDHVPAKSNHSSAQGGSVAGSMRSRGMSSLTESVEGIQRDAWYNVPSSH